MTRPSDIRRGGVCVACRAEGIYAASRCRRCYYAADVWVTCRRCHRRVRTGPGRLFLCCDCHDREPELLWRWLENRASVRTGQMPVWVFAAATEWIELSHYKLVARHLLRIERLILGGVTDPKQLIAALDKQPRGRATATLLAEFFIRHAMIPDAADAPLQAWGRSRLDDLPERLRPAAQGFLDHMIRQQHRGRLYGGRGLSDKTIAGRVNILVQLAGHLAALGVDDWAAVTIGNLESFLTVNAAQRIAAIRAFFAYTRRQKITLINPAADLRRSQRKGYSGPILTADEQRQLLLRWRRQDIDPRERVVGLLCLLHAATNAEIRTLTLEDLDLDAATVRLGARRRPVPLDPVTIDAIRACIQQRPETTPDNRYLLVTHQTRLRNQPCSIAFPKLVLDRVGRTPQQLRQTRLSDLAQRADPRMVAEVIGITQEGALYYLVGNVHRESLAFQATTCEQ